MKKKLQHLFSASVFAVFMFIAFGSTEDDKSENKSDIKTEETSNEQNLTDSQKDSLALIKKQNKEHAEKRLKSFKKDRDEFEDSSFFSDPRIPKYSNVNFIYPYIGNKNNLYWLRLKLQYASKDWLFINKAIIMIDDEKFNITGNWERDHNSEIWEWLDIPVEEKEYQILKKIADSKTVKIRYEGTQYHDDRTLTSKEKDVIKKTLEIYDNLK